MKKTENNYAFIDGANLHSALKELDWDFDYARFRTWLLEKYSVQRAYIFIGLIPKFKDLYAYLQKCGYTLIFKEVTYDGSGKPKGNCDADLVLQAARDTYENNFTKAILVASDGDYGSLVKFLIDKDVFEIILSPAVAEKCSVLLKRTGAGIAYLNDQKGLLRNRK